MTIFLQATVEGLSLAAIYSLVAIGFVLIYKSMDVLSFAQPALAVVGAGIISSLAVDRGLPFIPALLLAIILTTLIGMVIERVRRPNQEDGFAWYCRQCQNKLYDHYLHVSNIETQLPIVFKDFYSNDQHITCKKCGYKNSKE